MTSNRHFSAPQPVARKLRRKLSTDSGMADFLDMLIGPGKWIYDPHEDVWLARDKHHTLPGRGFIVIKRGGNWFKAVLPDEAVS